MKDLDRQLRVYYDEVVQRIDPHPPSDLQPAVVDPPTRGWSVAVGAAAAVLVVGAVTILLVGNGPQEMDSADSVATAAQEPPVLWGPVRLETFGDAMFAWNGTEGWRYSAGAWSPDVAAPTGMADVADTGDTMWALSGAGAFTGTFLEYLDGGEWRRLDAAPAMAWRIAAAPGTGILWISTGADLYRWDGTAMTNVGHPPNRQTDGDGDGYVGDIAVTNDGTVWAAGLYGYVPWIGGLAGYDDDTGSWELVRPLGGIDVVPATLLAPTPDGDLWVVLADWAEDWDSWAVGNEPPAVLTLVRHDGASGEWTAYREGLPGGYPSVMASDGATVWLALDGGTTGFGRAGGIARFDGRAWTTYLEDVPVDDTIDDIAIASDGTIWYTINGEIHQLLP